MVSLFFANQLIPPKKVDMPVISLSMLLGIFSMPAKLNRTHAYAKSVIIICGFQSWAIRVAVQNSF
jgi:hypothetical protein